MLTIPLQDVRTQNVMAASSIANIVKSSLGPAGLDKMMVDDVGDVTITNDGATILQLLEVEHPAAKVLVELAALQDEEVGEERWTPWVFGSSNLSATWPRGSVLVFNFKSSWWPKHSDIRGTTSISDAFLWLLPHTCYVILLCAR